MRYLFMKKSANWHILLETIIFLEYIITKATVEVVKYKDIDHVEYA